MKTKQAVKFVLLSGILFWLSSFTIGQPGDRNAETLGWYPFESSNTADPGMIGMNSWLEAPAGKYGRIKREGDSLVYNNEPMRIWGINNTFAECAPDTSMASKRADFYAKYGINSVRLHKYGDGTKWRGILSGESFSEFDPEGLDRMDFYISELKSRGIYVKLSPSFGPPRLMPEDRRTVPYMDEFGPMDQDGSIRVPHSAIFYSPEIQEVHIRQIVNLLEHRNPYTGSIYAEDPAIWDIEIINEQSILFYTSSHGLEKSPTLRKHAAQRFSSWLKKRYGDQAGLEIAWGERAINSFDLAKDENIAKGTVVPMGNPFFWNKKTLAGPEAYRKQRHLDTLDFLTGLQLQFYKKVERAIRDTGYMGEVSGSNWQAGSSLSHFANLWTDAQVGTIDRHNYFGGILRNRKNGEERINNSSMLARAGKGMLSSGMQQVSGLPFMLSEWIHVWPNDWGVEGPAIIGAYGMGLQGWDVSYMFQNYDKGGFSEVLGSHNWDVSTPQIMGAFPAIARQVLRGDVTPSSKKAVLNVHAPGLFEGEGYDFVDQVDQGYDDKVLQTDKVGPAALAAVRVEVRFTDEFLPTRQFDFSPYRNGNKIRSSTGQLQWIEEQDDEQNGGYFTVDTEGTQAIVGFAGGKVFEGEFAKIEMHSDFAAVYLSSLDKEKTLAADNQILITAIARARNSGQKFDNKQTRLLANGDGPILMEPVRATIRLNRNGAKSVTVLDHDGFPQNCSVPIIDGAFLIDTGEYKTPYFVINF